MPRALPAFRVGVALFAVLPLVLTAAPAVTRLTPPSGLFSYGDPAPPYVARFLPGQRFDLQATIRPDPEQTITKVEFFVDGVTVPGQVTLTPATSSSAPAGAVVATIRANSRTTPGVRILTVIAAQSDGATATATGNFEVVDLSPRSGTRARNIIFMIGDGMGVGHRTATRLMLHGVSQGKSLAPLAMDTFPASALVKVPSLTSLITDSAAGGSAYASGNKTAGSHSGVFPDDTRDKFDNPRVELLAEYLARTQGKWLGIVTTADVTDATPAAFAGHFQDRTAMTGIADGFFDEALAASNLRVLLGGGRRQFLPNTTPGSGRAADLDATLPTDLVSAWGAPAGKVDPERDLVAEFRAAGFSYAATRAQLAATPASTRRLLGLFSHGALNSAMERIHGRRGTSTLVSDVGFPDQPMLDEMTEAALAVLRQNAGGFILMVEGALIDRESHAMDTERWLHEMIEFDRAVARARAFAAAVPDTLVIVTADHETGGVSLIGGSRLSQADLAARAAAGGGASALRDGVVDTAGVRSPVYTILADGYPATTDVDRRMIVGYGANADRYEDWQTNPRPAMSPIERDAAGGYFITGQVPGLSAGHTGADVPLSALGVGASTFAGVLDNTDVFFKVMQAAIVGAVNTAASGAAVGAVSGTPAAGGQRTAGERLLNLSSRGLVGGGAGSLISGFVLGGTHSHRLLIRGVGPTLDRYGVENAVRDPVLRLWMADGVQVAENEIWEADGNGPALRAAAEAVGAFPLGSGSRDAAMLLDLLPGNYTVELASAEGRAGQGLLEIYELP